MASLTSVERVGRILKRQPVDRVAVGESFWGDTHRAWVEKGNIPEGTDLADYFNFDYRQGGWPNLSAHPGEPENIIEENEEWKLVRNSNGAHLRYWKGKATKCGTSQRPQTGHPCESQNLFGHWDHQEKEEWAPNRNPQQLENHR